MVAVTTVLLMILMSGRLIQQLAAAAAGEVSLEIVFFTLLLAGLVLLGCGSRSKNGANAKNARYELTDSSRRPWRRVDKLCAGFHGRAEGTRQKRSWPDQRSIQLPGDPFWQG